MIQTRGRRQQRWEILWIIFQEHKHGAHFCWFRCFIPGGGCWRLARLQVRTRLHSIARRQCAQHTQTIQTCEPQHEIICGSRSHQVYCLRRSFVNVLTLFISATTGVVVKFRFLGFLKLKDVIVKLEKVSETTPGFFGVAILPRVSLHLFWPGPQTHYGTQHGFGLHLRRGLRMRFLTELHPIPLLATALPPFSSGDASLLSQCTERLQISAPSSDPTKEREWMSTLTDLCGDVSWLVQGPIESVAIREILGDFSPSLKATASRAFFRFRLRFRDVDIVLRPSPKKKAKAKSRNRGGVKTTSRGKWGLMTGAATFLHVSATDVVIRTKLVGIHE